MISLLLVDGHEVVRKGIRALVGSEPDLTVAGEASDGLEALRLAEETQPDVMVLELMLKGIGGLEVMQQLNGRSLPIKTVILSMYGNEVYVVEALRAGAQAYVLKDSSADELLTAIRKVAVGQSFLCSRLAQRAFDAYSRKNMQWGEDPYEALTNRERQILHLIVQEELSSALIAKRLYISRRTVEIHRSNMMRKLSVKSHNSLIRYAIQRGFLPPLDENGDDVDRASRKIYSMSPV
ncbi:MAG: response regulator transcription factor [Chloroflexi bacterium]|nr:response regulator transcription factor [Chloroflexota bacterium]